MSVRVTGVGASTGPSATRLGLGHGFSFESVIHERTSLRELPSLLTLFSPVGWADAELARLGHARLPTGVAGREAKQDDGDAGKDLGHRLPFHPSSDNARPGAGVSGRSWHKMVKQSLLKGLIYHAVSDDYFASRGLCHAGVACDDGSPISFAPYTRRPAS